MRSGSKWTTGYYTLETLRALAASQWRCALISFAVDHAYGSVLECVYCSYQDDFDLEALFPSDVVVPLARDAPVSIPSGSDLPSSIEMFEILDARYVGGAVEHVLLHVRGTGDGHDFSGYYLSSELMALQMASPDCCEKAYLARVVKQAVDVAHLCLGRYALKAKIPVSKIPSSKCVRFGIRHPDRRLRLDNDPRREFRYTGRVVVDRDGDL